VYKIEDKTLLLVSINVSIYIRLIFARKITWQIMKKSNSHISISVNNPYYIKVILCFIITITLISSDTKQASASIFDTAFDKIKSLLNSNIKTEAVVKSEENQKEEEFVLRANSKTIVEKRGDKKEIKENFSGESSSTNTFKDDANFLKNSNEENTLKANVGPLRTSTDEEVYENDTIQVYEVKEGDTLSDIAKMYNVSKNTIAWANDIKNGKAKQGEILVILPVSGVKHTVKKGDTLKSLAKKYNADIDDISEFNNITNSELATGDEIIVPDGSLYADSSSKEEKKDGKKNIKEKSVTKKRKIYASAGDGYFTKPIIGGIKTQGIHGYNGVDIGAPVGSTLLAAANGTVQVAKGSGWNGGYGKMVIISHPNGTQTVYGHMNAVYVTTGQVVSQGEVIGESGNTGKSTGPHLHFEVRGASNPF
jgi:LysM repeat protein